MLLPGKDFGITARNRPVGTKFILSGLKRGAGEVRKDRGPGLTPRKFSPTTPFRSLENVPFLDDLSLKKATDHNRWESFEQNF